MQRRNHRFPAKRRAPQGELRNLSHDARAKLFEWFREQEGTVPYREIQRRLKEAFDLRVGETTLSVYYNANYQEINPQAAGVLNAQPKTILIRIEVPAGCRVDVSTESSEPNAEGR